MSVIFLTAKKIISPARHNVSLWLITTKRKSDVTDPSSCGQISHQFSHKMTNYTVASWWYLFSDYLLIFREELWWYLSSECKNVC